MYKRGKNGNAWACSGERPIGGQWYVVRYTWDGRIDTDGLALLVEAHKWYPSKHKADKAARDWVRYHR